MRHALSINGILVRSIAFTIIAFILVGVVTLTYTVRATRDSAERASQVRLNQLLDTVESTLRVTCFVKDSDLATEVARGLLSNPEVLRVAIIEGKETLADVRREGKKQQTGERDDGLLQRDITSPFKRGEIIGKVMLTPDPAIIASQIRDSILAEVIQLIWQLTLISGAVVVTLLFFVVRPISAMSYYLHGMDPTTGDRLPIPNGHRHTEIGHLAGDVNALAERLVKTLEEEHALRLQREVDENKYHAIFDNAESGIFIVNRESMLTSWNSAFARLLDIARADDYPGSLLLPDLGWESPAEIEQLLEQVFSSGETHTLDTPIRRRDHARLWLSLVLSPVGNDLLQGVAHDISELKEAEASARRQVVTDPLTGLANRAGLEALLQNHISQYLLSNSRSFTLLLIDLDKFRQIIEGIGIPAGDEILRVTAVRLSAIVKHNDSLARLSSDIFAVLLQNLSHDETIDKVVARIMQVLRQPYIIDGSPIHLSASIGITLFPNDGSDAPSLLRHAELAIDKAKAAGGNQATFFDLTLAEAAEHRRHLENDLRQAVREQQFILFYQPIVDLQHNRLAGAEALIRWRHPEKGLVPPDKFIPIVEQSGLINEIGLWVLESACEKLGEWQAAGHDYYLSINVSGRQIPNGLPPSSIADALQRHGIAPERLALEITEGVLLSNIDEALAWLQAIKHLGVRTYLDDFGTGYSSLSYLKRFPLDTLKVDRSFVQDMQYGNSESLLVEAIIAMARSLRLSVVAEGVETAQHLQMLRDMGCHYAQGYYLARPLPAEDFLEAAEHIQLLLAQDKRASIPR